MEEVLHLPVFGPRRRFCRNGVVVGDTRWSSGHQGDGSNEYRSQSVKSAEKETLDFQSSIRSLALHPCWAAAFNSLSPEGDATDLKGLGSDGVDAELAHEFLE